MKHLYIILSVILISIGSYLIYPEVNCSLEIYMLRLIIGFICLYISCIFLIKSKIKF